MDALTMSVKLSDKNGRMIPRGVIEEVNLEIVDELAIWHFKNAWTTKKWVSLDNELEKAKGIQKFRTKYIEQSQKAATLYPGMKAQDIKKLMVDSFKNLRA